MQFVELSDISRWDEAARHLEEMGPGIACDAGPLSGLCPVCQCHVTFAGALDGEVREGLHCSNCRSNTRQRAVALLLFRYLSCPAEQAQVYAAEQLSGFFQSLHPRFHRLHGGEYGLSGSSWLKRQLWLLVRRRPLQRLRLRDLTALDFPAASLDAHVSQDVLEHVPDYRKALAEAARVLRPGGILVFTVPFYWDRHANQTVAWLDDSGQLQFSGEPEYHGDPVSGGVLCFHHFGWELLDDLRQAGFSSACAVRVKSIEMGVPKAQWVFLGRR